MIPNALREIVGLMNPAGHSIRTPGKDGFWYKPFDVPITDELLEHHLTRGDDCLGAWMVHDDDKSHVCIFDFDDHDKMHLPELVSVIAAAVGSALEKRGIPYVRERSGSGHGQHIWVFFKDRKRVDSLHAWADKLLAEVEPWAPDYSGVRWERKAGGAILTNVNGELVNYVEVLPKGVGKQVIALPWGRKSRIWQGGADVEDFEIVYHVGEKTGPKKKDAEKGTGGVDRDAAFAALVSKRDPNIYDDWYQVAMRLVASFGPEDTWAYGTWLTWSQTGCYKPGDEKKWDQCRASRLSAITFWLDAKKAGYTGNHPYKTADERRLTALSFLDDVRLLQDETGTAYAQLGPREFVRVDGREFKLRAAWCLHKEKDTLPSDDLLRAIATVASAEASREVRERVNLRFAEDGNKRYLFLADDEHTVIEIDAAGWRVCPYDDDGNAPVIFRRGSGLPLPMPEDGSLDELLEFLNIDRENMCFVLAWMINAIWAPGGMSPILLLDGPAGSGKSSALASIVRILDPKVGAQAGPPKNEDDLLASAYDGALVSFDNVSTLARLSDALCRLATGGGLRKRALYTNSDVHALDAKRPIIVAGIDPTMYQQDLIERVVRVELFRPDEYIYDMEERVVVALPRLLGAVLGLLSKVMGLLPDIENTSFRFGAYARIGEAVARVMGAEPGWFVEEYDRRLAELAQDSAEADSVLVFILRLIADVGRGHGEKREIKGKAAGMWEEMHKQIESGYMRVPKDDMPSNSRVMGQRINRAAPTLKKAHGISMKRGRDREFVFTWAPDADLSDEDIERMIHAETTRVPF